MTASWNHGAWVTLLAARFRCARLVNLLLWLTVYFSFDCTAWGQPSINFSAAPVRKEAADQTPYPARKSAGRLDQFPDGREPEQTLPPPPSESPRRTIPLSGADNADAVNILSNNERISLVVRGAPLSRVLAMLAETQGLNIVHGDDISSTISITLRDVDVEHALTAMLSVAGYTWARQNDIIHVTSVGRSANLPPEIQGRQLQVFQLDYASAVSVQEAVQGMLSPAGKVYTYEVVPTDNRRTQEYLAVEDGLSSLARVGQYIAQVDVPPRQVLIEAHILEVELKEDTKHGVNFEHMFNVDGNKVTLQTRGFANPSAAQAFFATIEGGNLDALVEALQSTTDAKTLAAPRVLVLNGQSAKLQVGEQLGFRVVTVTETSTLESVEFLEVGVVLTVTPRISRDDRIVLHVKPEISSGAVNPETGLPEEQTTEVETDLILNNGQGIVIGGLIREEDNIRQSKIPIVGDVWLVGKLFQRSEVTKARSEIVVALVPRLLPYDIDSHERSQRNFQRAQTPLFQGPLQRVPRPWEPMLPDANPQRHYARHALGLNVQERAPHLANLPGRCRCERCRRMTK